MFDFNRAPFYQSFVEVRVERSLNRVVFALHGADGPVRWRDMEIGRDEAPGGRADEAVEFVVEMNAAKAGRAAGAIWVTRSCLSPDRGA